MPRPSRDAMPDPERVFDAWFAKLSKAEQRRYRDAGIIPHAEMPTPNHVFQVIENHKAFSYQEKPDDEAVTEDFISSSELRVRLRAVFDALDLYASPDMAAYLAFIRTVLGGDGKTSLASLASRFGISKQAMAWRSRRILRALAGVHKRGALVDEVLAATGGGQPADLAEPPPAQVPGEKVVGPYLIANDSQPACKKAEKHAKQVAGVGGKASLCSKVSSREAGGPASFSKKPGFRGGRYQAAKAQPQKVVKKHRAKK